MAINNFQHILATIPPRKLITLLDPFINPRRKARIEEAINNRLNSLQLAIEAPADINNALAAVRSCEAMGISNIHLIAPEGDAKYVRSVTTGAFYWIDIAFYSTFSEFFHQIKQHNFLLAGAIMTGEKMLSEVPIQHPICLLFGNEQTGLSDEALSSCDLTFKIPMFGMSESLNLSVSCAISIYETSTRKRASLDSLGDLTHEQCTQLRAKYYLNSVDSRLIQQLQKASKD